MTDFPIVRVTDGRQRKLLDGSPWIYRNEIHDIEGQVEEGGLVRAVDFRGRKIGIGIINTASIITVRLLTYPDDTIDEGFITRRVLRAVAYRDAFRRPDSDGIRLVFGEADGLPGIVADRFGPVIVMQVHALGMERWLDVIANALIEREHPETLIVANDDPIRLREGLPLYRTAYFGPDRDETTLLENGLRFRVDLQKGQKTGHFLDQKANHRFLAHFARGRRVLDAFTYTGGFALHAAAYGADHVDAVDISDTALACAQGNAAANGFNGIDFVKANVFDDLRARVSAGERYDVVILDPPAFAASRKAREGAIRGYKEINLSAMKLLPPGGILATHTCSFHLPESMFVETVLAAARDLGRHVRIVAMRRQDHDHPVLAGHPESYYLKSLWLEMVD